MAKELGASISPDLPREGVEEGTEHTEKIRTTTQIPKGFNSIAGGERLCATPPDQRVILCDPVKGRTDARL